MLRRVMLRVLVVLAALTWACGDFVLYDAFLEPLSLSPSSAYLMVAESRSFEASGGTPGYRYRLRSGGGSIDPATGLFTAPATAGECLVEVVDSGGRTASALVSVFESHALAIVPAAAALQIGAALQFEGAGGEPPYSFVLYSGVGSVSPAGLYLASAEGDAVVKISDGEGSVATAFVSVLAPAALTITPLSTTITAASTFQFVVLGGTPPYAFAVTAGLGSVNATGLYSAPPGATTATLRASDSASPPAVAVATVTVVSGGALGLSSSSTAVEEGATASFQAYGGTPPYAYSLAVSGSGGSVDAGTGLYTAGHLVGAAKDRVRVTDAAAAPATFEVDVDVLPAAPSGLTADGSYGGPKDIRLTWTDHSSSEGGFSIERKEGTGAYAFLAATAAGATFYDDTNLVPNVGYSYRLRSFSGALYSPYSNEAFDVPNN